MTQEYLKLILHYNLLTGIWTWLVNKNPRARLGDIAGCIACQRHRKGDGCEGKLHYLKIRIDGKLYLAHQLAFLYMTGSLVKEIDHIDGNGLNNRWNNLRECTRSQNKANITKLSNNSSGYKGVYWRKDRQKWIPSIDCEGRTYHLGCYSNIEDAKAAYDAKSKELFGGFCSLCHSSSDY
jgi:hypothetical protein